MISIVGMPGIGKTTLVQLIYNHPSISSHFDTRIMVTIGPKFMFRDFLLLVLRHVGVGTIERLEKLANRELKHHFLEFFRDQNLLIVLDGVWDDKILIKMYELIRGWPSSVESRIIFTSELHGLAPSWVDSFVHKKCFLSYENSWDLLHRLVFTCPQEFCTQELEKIGRQIAKYCEGLPLAIVLIAKLHCQEKTIEYWKKVSEDENPLNISVDDNHPISKSLYFSYKMLPQYLKPCFLYMGVFPKNCACDNSNIIRLWVIEGFITPFVELTIEDIAQLQLRKLALRSVVLVSTKSLIDEYKACGVHIVFRNLCISVGEKEEFCHVIKKYAYQYPQGVTRQSRVCIHNNVVLSIKEVRSILESMSYLRTLLCFGPQHAYPLSIDFHHFKLLRILDALRIRFYMLSNQLLELVRLRYLAMTYDGELPTSIFKLGKLQVLIVNKHHNIKSLDTPSYLPVEIWDLKWLRHLQLKGTDLPDPRASSDGCYDCLTLKYLITLSGVGPRNCTQRVLARMPSLKKLGIQIMLALDEAEDFNFFRDVAQQLQHLWSFKCIVSGLKSQIIPTITPIFPYHVRKMTLSGCKFPWKYANAIGKLPYLNVLKLQCHAFHGSVWEPSHQARFLKLQYLLLEDLAIEEWRTHIRHFWSLRHLIIRHCYRLKEIPSYFDDSESLEMIEVESCSPSLIISAQRINCNTRIYSSFDEDN